MLFFCVHGDNRGIVVVEHTVELVRTEWMLVEKDIQVIEGKMLRREDVYLSME